MANSRMRISLTRKAQAALHTLFLYENTNALCVATDYQRKNWVPYLKINPRNYFTNVPHGLDSEDDFRSGCRNVSHQEQFFSELPSPGRSHYTI